MIRRLALVGALVALGAPAPWASEVTPMSPAWRAAVPAVAAVAAE